MNNNTFVMYSVFTQILTEDHNANLYDQSKPITCSIPGKYKNEKNACLIFKQAVFPATYITVNMFITVIFLTTYKKIEYDLFEQTDSLITYNYCDMETYFYIDIAFVIIVSCMLGASFDDRETTSKLQ